MEAKTYRVKSIADALELIRTELGPDASVLHTRKINGGLLDWFRGPMLEVVASNDIDVPSRYDQWLRETEDQLTGIDEEFKETLASESDDFGQIEPLYDKTSPDDFGFVSKADESFEQFLTQNSTTKVPSSQTSTPATTFAINEKANATQATTQRLVRDTKQHANGWQQLLDTLQAIGCDRAAAEMLCGDLKQVQAKQNREDQAQTQCPDWERLATILAGNLKRGGTLQLRPGYCQRVALVGPTGVGKTTTLAKLAAEYQFRRGCKVGLVTVDTFRVGAVDQLKEYAQIMGVPFLVVSNEQEMKQAMEQLADLDLVLIDTIGRSPRDPHRISSLRSILRVADLDQIQLAVSSASSHDSLQQAYQAFRSMESLAPTSLILTKVDECRSLAHAYPFLKSCPLPWSYWTNGQNVPDDIGIAMENVAIWLLDEIQTNNSTDHDPVLASGKQP